MIKPRPDIAETLTRGEVARLLGISARQFEGAVERGDMPGPVLNGRPKRWSRVQIHKALEGVANLPPSSEPLGDPIMEAIDREWPASK